MLLEFNCPPAPKKTPKKPQNMLHLPPCGVFGKQYWFGYQLCVALGKTSIQLVFVSSREWRGVGALLGPPSSWTLQSCGSKMFPLQFRLSSESFVQRNGSDLPRQLVVCLSSAVFTVFSIVLEEQPFLKRYFKIPNFFSSGLVVERGKCREGNWAQ